MNPVGSKAKNHLLGVLLGSELMNWSLKFRLQRRVPKIEIVRKAGACDKWEGSLR